MENETNIRNTAGRLKAGKSAALTVLAVAILTDIFFIAESFDLVTFFLLGSYVVGILVYKLPSGVTFLLCLALLILAYIQFVFLGPSATTEKSTVWFVLFFIVGVIQRFRE